MKSGKHLISVVINEWEKSPYIVKQIFIVSILRTKTFSYSYRLKAVTIKLAFGNMKVLLHLEVNIQLNPRYIYGFMFLKMLGRHQI